MCFLLTIGEEILCPTSCLIYLIAGTMQTLDVRHFELFLHKEYKDGSWDEVGSHTVHCNCLAATAGIFYCMHINSDSTTMRTCKTMYQKQVTLA